jgi:hypothetical protein
MRIDQAGHENDPAQVGDGGGGMGEIAPPAKGRNAVARD